jgi:uncharacterized membrane protein YdfJ with MMPL/SSD domain
MTVSPMADADLFLAADEGMQEALAALEEAAGALASLARLRQGLAPDREAGRALAHLWSAWSAVAEGRHVLAERVAQALAQTKQDEETEAAADRPEW